MAKGNAEKSHLTFGRAVSLVILVLIILALGVVFLRVMAAFLLPLFLAALMVVMFRPVHRWMLDTCKGRARLAAILTTAAILLIVFAPVAWILTMAISEASALVASRGVEIAPAAKDAAAPQVPTLEQKLEDLRQRFGLQMPYRELIIPIGDELEVLQLSHGDDDATADTRTYSAADFQSRHSRLERLIREVTKLGDELESAVSQTNATGAADQRRRDRAALAVQSKRLLLGNLIDVDELLHHAFEEWGEQEPLATQLTKLAETYDEEIGQAQAAYRNMRQQLQGGPTLAWMTELANPSESEMQVWRGKAAAQLQKWLLSMTGQTTALLVRLLVGLGIMTLGMYYFLIDGPAMITTAMRLSPLDDDYERELLVEFDQVSRAVVLATLLSAAAQGLLAGIGYYFAGLHSIFLLTALTAILALVPFVGAAAVWVPACLYLWLVQDRIVPAGVLAAYGFGVISMADNLIKPMVLHGQSKLHPLLALLSVLGGVQVLGPIGILVGPMVVSFLQALLNMLHKELAHMDGQTPRQRK